MSLENTFYSRKGKRNGFEGNGDFEMLFGVYHVSIRGLGRLGSGHPFLWCMHCSAPAIGPMAPYSKSRNPQPRFFLVDLGSVSITGTSTREAL